MQLIKTGNVATIFLSGGRSLIVQNFTNADVDFCRNNQEDEDLILSRYSVLVQENQAQLDHLDRIRKSEILDLIDDRVVLTEVSTEIGLPDSMIQRFLDAEDNQDSQKIRAYRNFWRLLCMNPNAESRANLIWFLETHNFKILNSGMFVAYRAVVTVYDTSEYSKEEIRYIDKKYRKIVIAEKNPQKYVVFRNSSNEVQVLKSKHALAGTPLEDVLDSVHARYTDNHTRTMNIRLGIPVQIPRSECDSNSNNECSQGLVCSPAR